MKMKLITIILIVLAMGLGGYRVYEAMTKDGGETLVTSIPVRVSVIEENDVEEVLSYEGRVAPALTETVSFKSTARLARFNGEVGETIKAGTVLAELDQSDMALALEAAASQLAAATAGYDSALKGGSSEEVTMASLSTSKAQEAVDYLRDLAEDGLTLFQEGLMSESEYNGLALELALAEKDLALAETNYQKAAGGAEPEVIRAAKAQTDAAASNEKAQQSLIDDAAYSVNEDRILVKQMFEPGELVPAGYPVAVLRSLEQVVVLGASGKDMAQIYEGQQVHVEVNQEQREGLVERIAEIPDDSHFLYEVEIALLNDTYLIGELVKCELVLGQRTAVTIPVTAIMNDGIDYVYLAEDNRAIIRKINVEAVVNGQAIVEGLMPGDQMIVSNLNRIQEQTMIHIEE